MANISGDPNTGQSDRLLTMIAWVSLALASAAMAALLVFPVNMPIGAMYWDSYLYLDASNRIASGQQPNIDFFTPVGPLDYYLFHWLHVALPNAQPMLAASWSFALVTMPAMALVIAKVTRDSPITAVAIAIPFAAYTFLPFNTTEAYTFPGSDGYGIYNRHTSQLLYVLVAALLFVRQQAVLAILVAVLMAALFFTKVTGFAVGGLLCLVALLGGRITIVAAIASAALASVSALILELTTGMVSAYIGDIITLLSINQGSIMVRLVQGASRTGAIVIFGGLLALWLFISCPPWAKADPQSSTWQAFVDHPAVWLGAALAGGVVFESQNTGSQEIIFIWPVAIYAAWHARVLGKGYGVAMVLAALAVLPPLAQTVQHTARATLAMVRQVPLQHENLRAMGQVHLRPRMVERQERLEAHYLENPDVFRRLADRRELPAFVLYSEHDFQIGLIRNIDAVASELKRREAAGLEYETIMTLNFSNPHAWVLNKQAPRHITIGADPYRAVPPPDADVLQSIGDTDIVLEPQCPYADNVRELYAIYEEALQAHRKVRLNACYIAYVHPRIADQF
ncbi:MAG: hypothetical protein AAF940_11335 [Pseudomonadota bacterium]